MSKLDQSQPMKKNCMELLQSILDGEASSSEQKEFVEKHLETCLPCYKNYHLEMAIRELLKTKCQGQEVPSDLVDNIRGMIDTNGR